MTQRTVTGSGWDVASWVFGPRHPYRINTSYRCDDGVIVTATGRFDTPTAAADLGSAVRCFETLPGPMLIDVCHAVLDDAAARTLVETAARRGVAAEDPSVIVVHADPGTARRVIRAGGSALLRSRRG